MKHNYGWTHAAIVLAAMAVGGLLAPFIGVAEDFAMWGIAILLNLHFYIREKKARGDVPFKDWHNHYGSVDTQFDVITPIISSGVLLWLYYNDYLRMFSLV